MITNFIRQFEFSTSNILKETLMRSFPHIIIINQVELSYFLGRIKSEGFFNINKMASDYVSASLSQLELEDLIRVTNYPDFALPLGVSYNLYDFNLYHVRLERLDTEDVKVFLDSFDKNNKISPNRNNFFARTLSTQDIFYVLCGLGDTRSLTEVEPKVIFKLLYYLVRN